MARGGARSRQQEENAGTESHISLSARDRPKMLMTVGHSTRTIEQFLELLRSHGVEALVDIRTVPKSRANPQFAGDALAKSLTAAGIEYRWIRGLGGLRHARKDSTNTGWRNASFRGYADYMQTPEFESALAELMRIPGRTAILCAEAVPWRCHRSLVADALTARGVEVWHLMGAGKKNRHHMTPFAKVEGERVTYP
jgi:uncharacterized protein (DUF488 family)